MLAINHYLHFMFNDCSKVYFLLNKFGKFKQGTEVPPRYELGSSNSKFEVLAISITPRDLYFKFKISLFKNILSTLKQVWKI